MARSERRRTGTTTFRTAQTLRLDGGPPPRRYHWCWTRRRCPRVGRGDSVHLLGRNTRTGTTTSRTTMTTISISVHRRGAPRGTRQTRSSSSASLQLRETRTEQSPPEPDTVRSPTQTTLPSRHPYHPSPPYSCLSAIQPRSLARPPRQSSPCPCQDETLSLGTRTPPPPTSRSDRRYLEARSGTLCFLPPRPRIISQENEDD